MSPPFRLDDLLRDPAPASAAPVGLLTPGNLDLSHRPRVKNADGSVSTVRSISVGIDGKEVLLPTVSPDGQDWDENQAVENYRKTGQHLGIFKDASSATAYAQQLHESQAAQLEHEPDQSQPLNLDDLLGPETATPAAATTPAPKRGFLDYLTHPKQVLTDQFDLVRGEVNAIYDMMIGTPLHVAGVIGEGLFPGPSRQPAGPRTVGSRAGIHTIEAPIAAATAGPPPPSVADQMMEIGKGLIPRPIEHAKALWNAPDAYSAGEAAVGVAGDIAMVTGAAHGMRRLEDGAARMRRFKEARQALADRLDPARANLADRVSELEIENRAATRAAERDDLTGLANRRALDRALPAAEADPKTAVTVFDANNFGKVNKIAGHEQGDAMLADMGQAIQQAADEHGLGERVFRRGGDEFVVLAPHDVAHEIRQRAEELYGERQVGDVTVSLSGHTADTFAEADGGLQDVKATRKAAITAQDAPGDAFEPEPVPEEPPAIDRAVAGQPAREAVLPEPGAPRDEAAVQEGLFGDRTLQGNEQTSMLPESAGVPTAKLKPGKIMPEEVGRVKRDGAEPAGARPAELEPVPESVSPKQKIENDPAAYRLPADLSKSAPRYGFGNKQVKLQFASDFDRAAYILQGKTQSKAHARLLAHVQEQTGLTPEQISKHGEAVKAGIKERVRNAKSGDVVQIEGPPPPSPRAPEPVATKKPARPKKAAKMTDAELEQRFHDVLDRKDQAQQTAGRGINPWARYDDDVAHTMSGTAVTGEAGRAIGRVNDDTRILGELELEMQKRGMDIDEVVRRYLDKPSDATPTAEVSDEVMDMLTGADKRRGERGALRIRRPPASAGMPANVAASYDRARESIDFSGRVAKEGQRQQAGSLSTRLQRFADQIANGFGPLERLGEKVRGQLPPLRNPKDLLSRVKAGGATVYRAIYEGVPDARTGEVVGPSYKSLFAPFKGNDQRIEQALTYAVQERAVGRGVAAFGGNHQAFADALVLVKHFRADPQMRLFRRRLEAYTDALGMYAVDSGLWTHDQWQGIKNSDALYIPYKRIMESESGGSGGPGRKLANITSGVKSFTGSRRAIHNPAQALAEYTSAIIRRADAYRVGASIFDAADAMGPEGEMILTRTPGPHAPGVGDRAQSLNALAARLQATGNPLPPGAVRGLDDLFVPSLDPHHPVIWRNGPTGREYGIVNAPDLYKAVLGLNAPRSVIEKFLDMTLRPVKRVFTLTTTAFVPRFVGGTNPARDIPEALAKSQHGMTVGDMARGIAETIGSQAGAQKLADMLDNLGTPLSRQIAAQVRAHVPGGGDLVEGAKRAGLSGVSMFGGPTDPAAVARQLAPTTMGQRVRGNLGRVLTGEHSLLRGAEHIGEISDLAPRMGEYIAALRKTQPLVDAGAWSVHDQRLYAVGAARQITLDFSNRPGNPVLRFFGDYTPFFNPALQGPQRFVQAWRNSPKRMAVYTAGLTSLAVLEWVNKHRSPTVTEKMNDRPPEERGAYVLFPIDDNADVTLRVPLSQEAAIIKAAVHAGLDAWMDHDPHAARPFIQSLIRALPPGVGEAVGGNPTIPIPVVQQIFENAANKQAYGGGPVVPKSMDKLPAEERRFDTTPETFSLLAKPFGASPLQAEHVVRGLTSQATPLLTAFTDPIARRIMGAESPVHVDRPLRSNPINPGSAFIANNPPYRTVGETEFYEAKASYEQAKARLKLAIKRGDKSMLDRLLSSGDAQVLSDRRVPVVLRVVDRALDQIRQQQTSIQRAARAGASPEQVRQALDNLTLQRQQIYRRATSLLKSSTDEHQ